MGRPFFAAAFAGICTLAACQLLLVDGPANATASDGGVDVAVEDATRSDDVVGPADAGDAALTDTATDAGGPYREAVFSDSPLAYFSFDATQRMVSKLDPDAEVFVSQSTGGHLELFGAGVGTGVPGVIGSAVLFPRTDDDFIGSAGLYNFVNGTSFTLECWVRPLLKADGPNIVISKLQGDNGYQLDLFRDDITRVGFAVGDEVASSRLSVAVEAGATDPDAAADLGWLHLVAVFDAGAQLARIFLNGVLITEGLAVHLPTTHPEPFRVGWRFRGYIDEVALYNYALPYGRVGVHYRAAPPR